MCTIFRECQKLDKEVEESMTARRDKMYLVTLKKLLGTKGISTRSNEATNVAPGLTT